MEISKEQAAKLKEAELAFEREANAIAEAKKLESEQAEIAKKMKSVRELELALSINRENVKLQAARRKEIQEEEKRIAEQYHHMMEEKNRMRDAAIEKRVERLAKMREWAEATMAPIGEVQSAKWQKLDERIRREEADVREAMERKQKKAAEAEESLCLLLRDENIKLMNHKKSEDEEFRRMKLEAGERMRQEIAEFQEYIQRKKAEELEDRKSYGSCLIDQMMDSIVLQAEADPEMTAMEESINKQALLAVSSDPSFHSRIIHRLRMSGMTPRTSRFIHQLSILTKYYQ
jgi:hypothetical protein